MKPTWITKTDPEDHPVRFLASIWQKRLASNPRVGGMCWRDQQYGQMKKLRESLGDLTQHVVEWMLMPENWWQFTQQVRTEAKLYRVPADPDLGFLLVHRNRARRIMRWALQGSTDSADIDFIEKRDQWLFQEIKNLALVYADGMPEQIVKIEGAKTLTGMQTVFREVVI